jgi:anti-sigma regulatory factor (Ser/Thr protein kinase)
VLRLRSQLWRLQFSALVRLLRKQFANIFQSIQINLSCKRGIFLTKKEKPVNIVKYVILCMITLDITQTDYQSVKNIIDQNIEDFWNFSCKIIFVTDFYESKIIRDLVGYFLEKNTIFSPWKARFILITDELINNSIEHGSRPWDINHCIIKIKTTKTKLKIWLEVIDSWHGKDSKWSEEMEKIKTKKAEETQWDNTYMGSRGRGLFHITSKLVDNLYFKDASNGWLVVWIEKSFTNKELSELQNMPHI